MFHTSTQRRFWMFPNEGAITSVKIKVHNQFVQQQMATSSTLSLEDFLTFEEATELLTFFERRLIDFCNRFQPPMPKTVRGTALQYFKRFYLSNSPLDYHPKEILVTATYLACKVEEFNVSIEQFVANLNGNKEKAMDIVLNNELLLLKELDYHLTVHNPFRPVEGLLIDVSARCDSIKNPEHLRPAIEEFLEDVSLTNASLIYAPSQIALAAIIHAASKSGGNMDSYVTNVLFDKCEQSKLANIVDAVRNIRLLTKNLPQVDANQIKNLQKKLEVCRNQENNPDSQAYKRKHQFEDEDDLNPAKNAKLE